MQAADFDIGLRDKLMGQVNLVLIGRETVSDGGSFTLSTGVLDSDPIRGGSSASMVNGAVNAFVMAAAIEMPRGLRINAVSPSSRSPRRRWGPTSGVSKPCPPLARRWPTPRAWRAPRRAGSTASCR
jgi:hypothetical protein